MFNRLLLFILLFIVSSHADVIKHDLFIVKKDFASAEKIVEKQLSRNEFQLKRTNDKIFEVYFDSPELFYLKNNGSMRYQAVEYESKKKKSIKYNENIQYSFDKNITNEFAVKHYNSVESVEEKHPLLSLIKRNERQLFIKQIKDDGLKYPLRLKAICQVSKSSNSFKLIYKEIEFAKVNLSHIESSAFDNNIEFSILEILVDQKKLQEIPLEEQLIIQNLLTEVKKNLVNSLDALNSKMYDNEYAIVYAQMEKKVWLFEWMLKYPYLVNLLNAIGLGLFGIVLVWLLFRKRLSAQ